MQPLGTRLRSSILCHHLMGGQHQAQSYGGITWVPQWSMEMLPQLRMVMQGWWDTQAIYATATSGKLLSAPAKSVGSLLCMGFFMGGPQEPSAATAPLKMPCHTCPSRAQLRP